jgi:hypothetical protein
VPWPGAAAAAGGPHQPPETPTAGPPAPSLDDVIEQALGAISGDCSPVEFGTLLFDPDKRGRTEAVEQVEDLIHLLRRPRKELNTKAPAPSGRPPFES